MNVVEENLAQALPSAVSVSAARKRRRQKRLKPLKTPDRLEVLEMKDIEKAESSPMWSLSPSSSRGDISSFQREKAIMSHSAAMLTASPPEEFHAAELDISPMEPADMQDVKTDQSEEIDITASTEALEPVKKTKKKKEKHKKSKDRSMKHEDVTSNATTISAALNEMIDTVEIIDESRPPKPRRSSKQSEKGSEISLISDGRVYVQHGRNFTATTRDKAFCRTGSVRESSALQHSHTTALSMAISYQKKFLPLSVMCHGLLAGIAIWQCIVVFQQNGDADTLSFVQSYSKVARVFQSLFYMLTTVACVAVLDRCVPSSFSWQGLWELLVLQPCCLFALVASCGALISSGIAAKLDDRLALHVFNETLWTDSTDSDEYLSEWLTSNLVRCVLAVVSYLIINMWWGDTSSALPFPEVATSVKPSSAIS